MPKKHLPLALSLADDGLVTRAKLRAAGLHPDVGDRLVREGRWKRLAPSVFLTTTQPPTDAQLIEAARHHAGPGAVVTGLVACRALGLPDVPPEPVVEVLIPPGTRAVSTPYVVVHQTDRAPQTWCRRGTVYAAPQRAVCDGGRRLHDLQAVRALLLGAVAQRLCSPDGLAAEVEAGAQRGSGLVRRAADDACAGAWSAPEAEAAELLGHAVRAGRLPPFLLNPLVHVGGLLVGRPDGWLVGTGVGWQVDSRRHHAEADDFDATLAVHDSYAQHGLTLLHVTPRRLRRLRSAWVEALVAAVQARAGRVPADLTLQPIGPLQRGPRRRALPPAA